MIVLIKQYLAPPVFADEDKTRIARVLNTISLSIMVILVGIAIVNPFVFNTPVEGWVATGVMAVPVLSILLLIRHGHVRIAGRLFAWVLWTFDTVLIYVSGGIHSGVALGYLAVVVLAGLLLGGRAAIVFAGLSALAGLGMVYAERNGILVLSVVYLTPPARWLSLTANLLLTAALLYLATRSIDEALARARRHERALARTNDELRREVIERKQAERALQESHEQLELITDKIPALLGYVDAEQRYLYVNQAYADWYGRSKEELVGQHLRDVLHEDSYRGAFHHVEAVLRGEELSFENVSYDTDGELRAVRAAYVPHFDEQGNVKAFLGLIEDITDRTRAEEARRRSEARYRALFEQANDAIFIENEDDEILDANRRACELLGYSRQELLTLKVPDLQAPEIRGEAGCVVRNELAQHGGRPFESLDVRSDGVCIPVEISTSPLIDEETGLVLSIVRDISERKRAEKALRESERRFRRAVVDAPFPIMIHAEDGEVVQINRVWEELTGYAHREVPTITDWTERAYGESKELARADIERLYGLDEKVDEGEYLITTSYGEKRTWDFNSAPLGRLPDHRRLVISMAMDVTERKQAEKELRDYQEHLEDLVAERTAELQGHVAEVERLNRALTNLLEDYQATNRRLTETRDRLRAANEELESFAYSVSHDLRAPLRAMDGFSRILLEDHTYELSSQARRYVGLVRENAGQMGQLIDDLLAFSRLSRRPIEKRDVAPADLINQVIQDLREEQEGRRVEITVGDSSAHSQPALPVCQADPHLLRQVWTNLLSNALKYTRQRRVARIEIGGRQEGAQCLYFIRDNGVGFDMRYADKLFGVFQRLHRAEDYEGTGVGLAIVQRIVRRHGGRVWAEAEVDEGATFFFTL